MAQPQQTMVVVAPVAVQPTQTSVVVHRKEGNACRAAIPAMHIAMAVTCLLLNIFVPGFGTIVAGFSVFCCGNPGQSGIGKCGTMCLNFLVGILQLATALILVGWIWSVMWGVAFIGMSNDYHMTNKTTTTQVTRAAPAPQAVIISQTPQQQSQPPPPQAYYPQQPPQGHMPPPQGYNVPPQGYPHPPQGYQQPPAGYHQPSQGYPQPQAQQGYKPPGAQYGYAPVPLGTELSAHQTSSNPSAPPVEAYAQQPAYNPDAPPPYQKESYPHPQKY